MAEIKILPHEVVNQIAAGEVLERPAFLVKELVENSLDAGATEIEIDFSLGGRVVTVKDNGKGMGAKDLPLALHPHATSKIDKSSDLFNLVSFGFRGEALASVSAVSELKITSRTANSENGFCIESKFGVVGDPLPVSSALGTQVQVSQLFENVPARLKFLKSDSAEGTQIKNTVKALALAHSTVSFRLMQDGDLKHFWPAQSQPQSRMEDILGVSPLYAGVFADSGLKVECWVSSPMQTAQTSRNIWIFAQNRFIQDRSIMAAVMEAYRNLLMHGEYPQGVIKISCAPADIDVNVHPTKSQVKFRDPQMVFRGVMRSIRSVLESAPWLGHSSSAQPASAAIQSLAQFQLKPTEREPSNLQFSGAQFERIQYPQKSFSLGEVTQTLASLEQPSFDHSVLLTQAESGAAPAHSFRWSSLQVIGQMNLTYIMAQTADSFYMVDQHAAHERIMFERLLKQFNDKKFAVQNYLLPLVIDLTAPEVEAIVKMNDQVERLGIYFEQMGPECIAVSAAPHFVSEAGAVEAIKKFAFEVCENSASFAIEQKVGDLIASMACHSAIRAGQALSLEQMKELLEQMDEFPLSSFCPHGRPVYVKKSFYEIEREFGRIV